MCCIAARCAQSFRDGRGYLAAAAAKGVKTFGFGKFLKGACFMKVIDALLQEKRAKQA